MIKEVFQSITDVLDMNYWQVIWTDNNGNSDMKTFYYKQEAREFYNQLPYYHKRMEKF